jgi:hypothetical protein
MEIIEFIGSDDVFLKMTEASLEQFLDLRDSAIRAELSYATNLKVVLPADHNFEFDKHAFAFVIKPDFTGDTNEVTPDFLIIASDPDIYEMLERIGKNHAKAEEIVSSAMFGVFTQGWAVQTDHEDSDDSIPPSEHPNRKRVQLVHILTMLGKQASAMRVEDMAETQTTMGGGQGYLVDAIRECVVKAIQTVEATRN